MDKGDRAFVNNDQIRVGHDGSISIDLMDIFSSPKVQHDLKMIAKIREHEQKHKKSKR